MPNGVCEMVWHWERVGKAAQNDVKANLCGVEEGEREREPTSAPTANPPLLTQPSAPRSHQPLTRLLTQPPIRPPTPLPNLLVKEEEVGFGLQHLEQP